MKTSDDQEIVARLLPGIHVIIVSKDELLALSKACSNSPILCQLTAFADLKNFEMARVDSAEKVSKTRAGERFKCNSSYI